MIRPLRILYAAAPALSSSPTARKEGLTIRARSPSLLRPFYEVCRDNRRHRALISSVRADQLVDGRFRVEHRRPPSHRPAALSLGQSVGLTHASRRLRADVVLPWWCGLGFVGLLSFLGQDHHAPTGPVAHRFPPRGLINWCALIARFVRQKSPVSSLARIGEQLRADRSLLCADAICRVTAGFV